MKSRNTALVALLFPLSFLLLEACTRAAAEPSSAPPPPKIDVAGVIARDVVEWDEFTGRLEAVNSVAIRPRVSGFVSAIRFDEGAMVKKGDLLFEIDARPFQAEVDRLQAELARTKATVQRATSELVRANKLSSEDAMSSEERDRRVAFAKESAAQVSAVEAALRAAQLNLEFTGVTSPIAGRSSITPRVRTDSRFAWRQPTRTHFSARDSSTFSTIRSIPRRARSAGGPSSTIEI
jgi:multidrug efflux system membrane fusion protein